jgi:DNA-directed RNA polymerase specialized sigma24 family protein
MAVDLQTLERLQQVPLKQWRCIYKELVVYAGFRLWNAGFKVRSEKDNVSAEDFATEAIEKIFDGTRTWDFERFPDLLIHLKGIVKSLIWNHIKSSERAPVKKTAAVNEINFLEDVDSSSDIPDPDNPETLIITEENWKTLESGFGDDVDGFIIFCEWLDGVPPREIAGNCNTNVTTIYNVTKKGKRLLLKILFN